MNLWTAILTGLKRWRPCRWTWRGHSNWSACWSNRRGRRRRSAIFCEIDNRIAANRAHPGDRVSRRPRAVDAAGGDRRVATRAIPIVARREDARVEVGPQLLGRVLDGFGKPMDDLGALHGATDAYDLYARAAGAARPRATSANRWSPASAPSTACCTCGKGQRIGIFGGSGVGKSTLLGAMCAAQFGRRQRDRPDRRAQPRSARLHRARAGPGGPEALGGGGGHFRPAGAACASARLLSRWPSPSTSATRARDVLLVMDSVTRLAMAQREIGLAAGEPPSQKGYTPSVFNLLPKIFERAGQFPQRFDHRLLHRAGGRRRFQRAHLRRGARDSGRPHRAFARSWARPGHYPAIDVLQSVSRLASRLVHRRAKRSGGEDPRGAGHATERSEDLINLGAYASGANPKLDAAIRVRPQLLDFSEAGTPPRMHRFRDTTSWLAGSRELARNDG